MLEMLLGRLRNANSTVKTITPAELKSRLDANEQLVMVDVRSPEEYEYDGRIEGSRLLPLPMLSMRADELPKDQTLIMVCRSGNRSGVACEQLAARGYTEVYNLVGGMIAWRQAGLPTR
jgi:rhodanese-related sulfurtransferase